MKTKEVYDIVIRYATLILAAIPNLWIFYFIFTPLTVYPVYFLLKLFFDVLLIGNLITTGDVSIEIIKPCVAGAAYYLLLILNLSTKGINTRKRIRMIIISFLSLLIINILRIFFLSLIFLSGSFWFYLTHEIFWYLLSIVFVVGIWFTEVKLFKIKQVPFYSDIKFLYKNIK